MRVACLAVALTGCATGATARGWRADDPDLVPLRHPGTVAVRCRPSDASLRVDGVLMGSASDYDGRDRLLKLAPGTHTVELSHPGFQSFSAELSGGDWRQTFDVNLAPTL